PPQKIKSAAIVIDNSDAVLLVKARSTGTAHITVKIDDRHGGQDTRAFKVSANPDLAASNMPINEPPILGALADRVTPKNKPLSFPLSAIDVEADSPEYAIQLGDHTDGSASISGSVATFTPRRNLTGPVKLF